MLQNIHPSDQLRSLAARKSKPDEYKSVRPALVEEETTKGWEVFKRRKSSVRLRRPKSHDKRLEDRVWTLMYRMGFKYLTGQGGAHLTLGSGGPPSSPDNQIDVVAIDDEVAFAVECKSSNTRRRFVDFARDLGKHGSLRDTFTQAVKSQFPAVTKRPSVFSIWASNLILSDNDRARAAHAGVVVLDEGELDYFEHLIGQIGIAARFQFLADVLQGREIPALELTVPAIRVRMGKYTAYAFSVPPEYLLKIGFVSHRARGKPSDIDAYQRMLKKSRLSDIRHYISEGGIFPTNIVINIVNPRWVSFDRGKQEEDRGAATFGWLHIRPASITCAGHCSSGPARARPIRGRRS